MKGKLGVLWWREIKQPTNQCSSGKPWARSSRCFCLWLCPLLSHCQTAAIRCKPAETNTHISTEVG